MIKPLPPVNDCTTAEYCMALYKLAGYEKGQDAMFNPARILINPEDWKRLSSSFMQTEGTAAGLFFMNYGPSTDENVPVGKIRVLKQAKEGLA